MNKIKKIRFEDIAAIFIFCFAFIYSKFYKKRRSSLWLLCESGFEARDNSYWLFKHIVEKQPETDAVFVISKDSPDFEKVSTIGETVEYKSFKHWVLYLSAKVNISTHKAGNPNAAVCYVLEVIFNLSKNRIFLQHGITLSDAKWLYYEKTKFSMFVCGAKPEFDYVSKTFGYPSENVKHLGFTRFDTLVSDTSKGSSILIMPSWRNWLVTHTDNQEVSEKEISAFVESDFYKYWNSLLTNKRFLEYCANEKIRISFFPHRNMQPYLNLFSSIDGVDLLSWEDNDIQDVIRRSSLMITDYSSVSLDFSYMDKPVIYYQFDEDKFRENQYAKGYFDYKTGGFGDWVDNEDSVVDSVISSNINKFKNNNKYTDRINNFFGKRDKCNNERTFNAINEFIIRKDMK